MQRRPFGELPVQLPQESQDLLVPMLGHAFPDHTSVQDVQGRKQGGGTMALVVVGHDSAASFLHEQPWLDPLQGWNLDLLVHAKDNGLVRRVEVQSHDVGEFLREAKILRELETFGPVGLQSMGVPDAVDH